MKLPPDAFERYVAMGPERSFQAISDEFGVVKRTVATRAKAEKWTERLAAIEAEAQVQADEGLVSALAEMKQRHLAAVRLVHRKAVDALRRFELTGALQAVKALDSSIKLERLIHGEASERTELSVEEVTKREMKRWLTRKE